MGAVQCCRGTGLLSVNRVQGLLCCSVLALHCSAPLHFCNLLLLAQVHSECLYPTCTSKSLANLSKLAMVMEQIQVREYKISRSLHK